MATVIDALVVTLGLDPAQFKKGSAEVDQSLKKTSQETTRTAREMEERGKQAAAFFGRVRNEALALLAVFTAGLGVKNFVGETVRTTSALGRLSQNLQMNTQDLAEWQLAARNAGGTVEGMAAQLAESADQVAKLKRGMAPETAGAFFLWGGKQEDMLKDGETYLLARARIVADLYKRDPARARLAADQMGLDPGQFNLYREGPEGIARRRREQAQTAAAHAAASGGAERLRQNYDTAMNRLGAVGVDVLTSMMPAFDFLVEKLMELGNWIITNKAQINEGVKLLVVGLEQLLKSITEIVTKLVPESTRKEISQAKDPILAGMLAAKEAIRPSWAGGRIRYDDPNVNAYATEVERRHGLPAGLLNAIKNQGEKSHSDQVSPKGAQGVMQFMPDTWKQYGKGDPRDPYASLDAAGLYFVDMLKRYGGNVDAAITEYNGGIRQARSVQAGGAPTAKETTDYLARVRGALGTASAASTARMAQAAQVSSQTGGMSTTTSTSTNNSTETNINGNITINTPATDGAGILRELSAFSGSQSLAQQANTGIF